MIKVTEEMVEAGLQHYSEGGCSGLADYERKEVVRDILEAALSAPAEPVGVGVRKLEWFKPDPRNSLSRAENDLGVYRTWTHFEANGRWFWSLDGYEKVSGECASEEEAKAAAQSDFESRILSALSPESGAGTHSPVQHVAGGEPAAWLHPTAGWAHANYHHVRLHCFNDGPMPVPLYRAAATEADHG